MRIGIDQATAVIQRLHALQITHLADRGECRGHVLAACQCQPEAAVARLRKKVGPGIIETRRGFGYEIGGEKA